MSLCETQNKTQHRPHFRTCNKLCNVFDEAFLFDVSINLPDTIWTLALPFIKKIGKVKVNNFSFHAGFTYPRFSRYVYKVASLLLDS